MWSVYVLTLENNMEVSFFSAVIENDELSRNFISKLFEDYYKHK